MFTIGDLALDRPLLLAPMEDVSDQAFRLMCRRLGADVVYTEFISSEGLIRDIRVCLEKLRLAEGERPVGIQIYGSNVFTPAEQRSGVGDRYAAAALATGGAFAILFTGDVYVDVIAAPAASSTFAAALVHFTPSARTAWHTHPAGQTLIVTTGTGWIQQWGGQKQSIKPGDVIWTPPGVIN